MLRRLSLTAVIATAPAALCGPASAPDALDLTTSPAEVSGHFRVSGGWMWRDTRGFQLETRSQSPGDALPFLARAWGKPGMGAGSAGGFGPRYYDNGFMLPDAGTPGDGLTWNWGYDDPEQLTGGGMLEMAGDFGSSRSDRSSHSDEAMPNWSPDGDGNAPVIQLDWIFHPLAAATMGLTLEWSFLNLGDHRASQGYSAYQESILRQVNVLDRYDLDGIIAPQAPYAGSAAGPGPLLSATPVERSTSAGQILDTDHAHFYNSMTSSFDVDLHTVSLGPSVAAHLGRLELSVSAGPALNVVNWKAEQSETLWLSRNGAAGAVFQSWHYQKNSLFRAAMPRWA